MPYDEGLAGRLNDYFENRLELFLRTKKAGRCLSSRFLNL